MHRIIASLVVFATFAIAPLAASAAIITVPTDLNVGDQYRLAFVTSTTRDATSTDIADYNAFVTALATGVTELNGLGTSWKAIGSTATVDARDNTGTNPSSTGVPVYRLDDTRLADNNADLWDEVLFAPLNTDELGTITTELWVWTGTYYDGFAADPDELGSGSPIRGRSDLADAWMEVISGTPETARPLYAMSDVLTVVPEPNTMFLLCVGATAVVGWQLRRRRRRRA